MCCTAPHLQLINNRISIAKKLKQSWVQSQKIKSKWKAQKHRDGLITGSRTMPLPERDGKVVGASGSEEESQDGSGSECGDAASKPAAQDNSVESDVESGSEDADEREDEEPKPEQRLPPSRRGAASRGQQNFRGRGLRSKSGSTRGDGGESQAEEKLSLREMQNQAYSRSSLHTFKSHSLHKTRGSDRMGPGRGRGRGFQEARGRGQPDMRLRMNAMLEKIKRDFT